MLVSISDVLVFDMTDVLISSDSWQVSKQTNLVPKRQAAPPTSWWLTFTPSRSNVCTLHFHKFLHSDKHRHKDFTAAAGHSSASSLTKSSAF